MGSEVELCFWKMFSLLFLPSLALAWQPAPGIPLDRQLPVRTRQAAAPSSYEEVVCDYEPIIQECNATTQIWCDGGSYNGNSCWFGNYCVQKVRVWNGCPGVCHTPCNWETEHFCDMGTKAIGENECWVGNWCQDISLGECPAVGCAVGVEASSSCSDPYESICEPDTQISCDGGHDSEGCWYGNYCIDQINEYDGCFGVCSMNCNYETEDWCDMVTDANGCWMGNWCQDKSMGGCPPPMGGSELNSGEDLCAHITTSSEACNSTQISCDMGNSPEGCWYGNYCANDGACIGSPSASPSTGYGYGVSPSGAPSPSSGYGYGVSPSGAPSPSTGYGYATAPSPSTGYGYGAPGVEMVRTDGTGYGTGYGYGTGTGYGYGTGYGF